ncbi:MAG: hypothetical protein E7384_07760 [Ruminococcaceae bacterium]|nr:hypothetical protein [Oscillospiraceae bacterium]
MKRRILSLFIVCCLFVSTYCVGFENSANISADAATATSYNTYTMSNTKLHTLIPNQTLNGLPCNAMQGLNVGTTYAYNVKIYPNDDNIGSANARANITRTNIDTGETVNMSYYASESATSPSICDTFGHANAITVYGYNSVNYMYVSNLKTPLSITRAKISGTNLYFTGFFKLVDASNNKAISPAGFKCVKQTDGYFYFIVKSGMQLYYTRISATAPGGTSSAPTEVKCVKLLTLHTRNAIFNINGVNKTIDYLDTWTNQDFSYNSYEDAIYVPLFDSSTGYRNVILVYTGMTQYMNAIDLSTNSGGSNPTVYPCNTNFYIEDSSAQLFEIESCGFRTGGANQADKCLYFNTNSSDVAKMGMYRISYEHGSVTHQPIVDSSSIIYNVKYVSNGGTGSMSTTTHINGITARLKKNTFTKSGYAFAGWNLTRSSDGKTLYFDSTGATRWFTAGSQPSGSTVALYEDGRAVSALSATNGDTVTCTAQWKTKTDNEKPYTLTPDDIIFDTANRAKWITDSGSFDASAAFGTDAGGDKCLVVTSAASNDPQITMNFKLLDLVSASNCKYMVVTAKTTAANKNAKMYLCAGSTAGPTESCATSWQWNNDGLWHDYLIDLSSLSSWSGNINMIRFDFFDGTTAANSVLYLRSVKFYASKPSSATITTNKTSFTVGESITLNYSGLTNYLGTKQNQMPFIAIYADGTEPGKGSALLYTYVNAASGSATFPDGAAGGTASGTTLPAGKYTAWVAYDANGSSTAANLNNVHYAASSASYDFTIAAQTIHNLSTEIVSGKGTAHFGNDVTSTELGAGTTFNYQVTPATGYKTTKISINGVEQTILNGGADAVYSYTMKAEDTVISVTFGRIMYSVTTDVISGEGTVILTNTGATTGEAGINSTFPYTVTPAEGYKVSGIYINGSSTSVAIQNDGAAATYSLTMTAAQDTTIAVAFTKISTSTTSVVDKVGNGAASGSATVFVKAGGNAVDVIAELKASLGASSVTITKDGEAVDSSAILGTGMVITADSATYTIVIKGDVDGDGAVTVGDASDVMASVHGTSTLTGAYKDAAYEVSGKTSGALSILDVMALLNSL